jgi:diguanylate cyclase (GGDEF)-like protein
MGKSTREREGGAGSRGRKLRSRRSVQETSRTSAAAGSWKFRSKGDLESLLSSLLILGTPGRGQVPPELSEFLGDLREHEGTAAHSRRAIAPVLLPAIKQMVLDRELRNLALTDDLTCLYNRRGFIAAGAQQLKLARRNMQEMILLCCDVDNLKQINELFGREEGDFALVRTADALEDAFRESDLLARLGGDEFAVLVSEASGDDQAVVLTRLKTCFQRANAAEPRYPLSLSVGAARFDPKHPAKLSELMERAERAMNERKQRRSFPFLPEIGGD